MFLCWAQSQSTVAPENTSECSKTPQNAAKYRKTLWNAAKRRKTTQNAVNALEVVANSPKNAAKIQITQGILRVRIVTIRKVIMKAVMKMREEGCIGIYARKRPVGVEINSSVLKLDVLVLVNPSQTQSLAKRRKTQQMRLRSSPICCKTPQNASKRSKCA